MCILVGDQCPDSAAQGSGHADVLADKVRQRLVPPCFQEVDERFLRVASSVIAFDIPTMLISDYYHIWTYVL